MNKDICLNCGKEHDIKLWGTTCNCGNSNVVHKISCTGCGDIMGIMMDNDYCGPEKIYCPNCMNIRGE